MALENTEPDFPWIPFYQAIAEKLLAFRSDRTPLVEGINGFEKSLSITILSEDKFVDGTSGPRTDICPFSTLAAINSNRPPESRREIATEMARILEVTIEVPQMPKDSIPVLSHEYFYGFSKDRKRGDIDTLWDIFTIASALVKAGTSENRQKFIEAYDTAMKVRNTRWNLTTGLYWAHPRCFPTLDGKSQKYIKHLDIKHLGFNLSSKALDGKQYLKLVDHLKARFKEDNPPVRSFPELALAAWNYNSKFETSPSETTDPVRKANPEEPYSVQQILDDGCFLGRDKIEGLRKRLLTKKNLILQGPPGTGKSWIAKRLAFVLIGAKDESKVRTVQFHPNLSYEDFVRGWRPSSEGKLELVDGFFMETINSATNDPSSNYVMLIEEINRGNPAQIFGEMLTLLEADKRTHAQAIELCYPNPDGSSNSVYIPENVYVIGTMNTADRSLALIDFAFRRRFAFASFEPMIGKEWRNWVVKKCGVDAKLARKIELLVNDLNQQITNDLGRDFQIGHSFVTPAIPLGDNNTKEWFTEVVNTEIGPLMEEYWFDSHKTAQEAINKLLADW